MTRKFTKNVRRILVGGAAVVAVSFCCNHTFAQTDSTWTGAGDGASWTDVDNWDSVLFPNGIFNVTIDNDAGTDTTVNTGTSQTINIDSLTVDLGDTLIVNNSSSFGIVTDAGRPGSGEINNDGSIQITNAGNNTNLVIGGEVNLNGTGTLTLGGTSSTSRILDNAGADGHFINNSNTIDGQGQIGVNSLQLTNHGLIDANVSGQSLVLDPSANGMTNDGTMMASNGGRLALSDGTFDNAGGTIEAADGSTVAIVGSAVVSNGTITSTGTGTVEVESSQTATISNVSNTGTINQRNSSDFFVDGNIDNQGAINVLNGSNNTDFVVDTATSLSGGGTLTLDGSGTTSRILDHSGADGALTNVDNTIQGKGQIGVNSLELTNHGTIDANVSGQSLVLDPNAIGMTNDGMMKATNGGRLALSDGAFDNAGGTIEAADGSTVALVGSAVVSNGTITSTGSGTVEVESSETATISNVSNTGTINQRNSSDLIVDGSIDNQGSINVLNGFNNTDFVVDTATSLSGGGTLTLDGSGTTSRILDQSGADGALTNVDNTIQGKGQIGVNTMAVVNQTAGVISANDATGTLVINPSTGNLTNLGTMNATGGGELVLTGDAGGQFQNTGGTIDAENDSTVRLTGVASVVGGDLNTSGSGQFLVGPSDNAELTNVALNGTLNVLNSSDLELAGTMTNQGSLNVTNGFNNTDIQIESDVQLDGGGTITLGGLGATSRILDEVGTADGALTNVDNLIQGHGIIGLDRMTMVNGAVIDANEVDKTLTLDPRNDGDQFTNTGTLMASGGGTLVLSGAGGGQFLNSGGLVEAKVDSTVQLTGVGAVVGGDLKTTGTGQVLVAAGDNAEIHDVTLDGQINVLNNSDLELFGTIENTGSITMANAFNNTDLQVETGVSLTGGGTITLGGLGGTSRILDEVGDTLGVLTNVDNTIQGKGQIGANRLEVDNQGLIDANDASGTLVLNPRDSGVEFTNSGTLRASSGGELVFSGTSGGRFLNSGGTIEALDGSVIRLANIAHVDGGLLQTSGSGKFAVGPGQNAELKDLTLDGLMEISNNTDVELFGTINNVGQIVVSNAFNNTDIQVEGPVSLTGNGTITLGGGSDTTSRILDEVGAADGVLTNFGNTINGFGLIGNGRLQFFNESAGTIDANVDGKTLLLESRVSNTNSGLFRASNGGTLEIVGDIVNSGTMRADMASLIGASGSIINDATGSLVGNGEIEAAFITNSGRIAPGASVGELTLDSDVIFGSSSLLDIEIDASGADLLTIMGSLDLDGDLSLELLSGYLPMETEMFTILTTDSLTGSFANVLDGDMLMTTDGAGSFVVNYGASSMFDMNSVVLSGFTAAIPEPGSALVLAGLGIGVLLRRRRS